MAYRATFRRRTYKRKGRIRYTHPVPGLHHEKQLASSGAQVIAGVDEVGVGAWAGPLAVGVVILDPEKRIYKIRDSKLLDADRRRWLAERIRSRCVGWSVGMSWPDEIDDVGLSEAMRRAARRALDQLELAPDAILLDGQFNFIGDTVKTVVRGDCESVSIAAASVVAKVARDSLMIKLSELYPAYRFSSNKGYPSPKHLWALDAFGPSPMHRRLFAPVRKLITDGTPGRMLPSPV